MNEGICTVYFENRIGCKQIVLLTISVWGIPDSKECTMRRYEINSVRNCFLEAKFSLRFLLKKNIAKLKAA